MNACNDGYVWRMIDPYDYVCVTIKRRQQIRNQQQIKQNHRRGICRKPLMLRNAFPSDNACVTRKEFMITQKENNESYQNMKYHSFFNGEENILM